MTSAPGNMKSPPSSRTRQVLTILAVIIGVAGLIGLGGYLHSTRPDYYQPERSALVLAKQRLYASFGEETDLLQRIHEMHQDMQAAIGILEQAEIEPQYRSELDSLLDQLRELDDLNRLQSTSHEELQRVFANVEYRLNLLIKKVEAQEKKN
ncbi:MAG: hypothetical protein ABW076_00895 [Candidatus Thiodiazotropha sp.]